MVVKSFKIWIVLAVAAVGFFASTESVRAATNKSNAHYSKPSAAAVNRSSAVRKSPSFAAKSAATQQRAATANRSTYKAPATRSQGSSFTAARKPAGNVARSQSTAQFRVKPQTTFKPMSQGINKSAQVARSSGNAGFKKASTPRIQSTAKPKVAALPKTLKSNPATGRVNSNGGHITKNVPLRKPAVTKPLAKVGTSSIAKKAATPTTAGKTYVNKVAPKTLAKSGVAGKTYVNKVAPQTLAKSGVGKTYVNKVAPTGQTNKRIVDVWDAPPAYQPAYEPKVSIPWTPAYNEPDVNVYIPARSHDCPTDQYAGTCEIQTCSCPSADTGCDTESGDANGSCDSDSGDPQCSGYTCPGDEEAAEEPAGEVVLSNSADSPGPVSYVINGEYTYTIEPGQTQTLQAGYQWSIDFDRGDSTGSVHYDLTTGSYEFQVADGHWDLFN